jgi:hypothetical protein
MPIPVSRTVSTASPPATATLTWTVPRRRVYWMAFSTRFRASSARSRAEPRTSAGSEASTVSATPASRARSDSAAASASTTWSNRTSRPSSDPPSSLDKSRRSDTTRASRTASPSSWEANLGTASGSSLAAAATVSASA